MERSATTSWKLHSKARNWKKLRFSVVSPQRLPGCKLGRSTPASSTFATQLRSLRKSTGRKRATSRKKIENAADVLKYGYGSGYDLTWLLVGSARAAGFEASADSLPPATTIFYSKTGMNSDELNSKSPSSRGGKDLFFDPWLRLYPLRIVCPGWRRAFVNGRSSIRRRLGWISLADQRRLSKSSARPISDQRRRFSRRKGCSHLHGSRRPRQAVLRNQDAEARKNISGCLRTYVPASIASRSRTS